jgi:hypothetical protein
MANAQNALEKIKNFLSVNELQIDNKDLIFRQYFNEAWFSNTLAWLLDPKASHNFGVKFANEFLKRVAQIRTNGSEEKYARRETFLKWEKSGKGKSSFGFSLKNASVIREFYLAKSIRKRNGRGPRFCDIAFFDLDSSDGLFLVIENKLFSSNHPHQLEEYYDTVENKFKRAKVREYVYLTINGSKPSLYKNETATKHKCWIQMSWKDDILAILNEMKCQVEHNDRKEHEEVRKLRNLLEWLKKLCDNSIIGHIEKLRLQLLESASKCLCEELQRLNDGKTGSWEIEKENSKSVTIKHTSCPKRPLYVDLLPNLSITVQSRKNGKALFEKIIVPYGSNTDQIYNLLDIAARDVYHYNFNGNKDLYLADKRRLTETLTEEKERQKNIFDFVFENQNELQILFTMSNNIWEAQEFELQETQLIGFQTHTRRLFRNVFSPSQQ